jgi:5-carboxymethyl-2-hydroxymuconate isomerase
MPHFIIECSKNVLESQSPETLMQEVYDTAFSTELFAKGDIKVRINPYELYNIGEHDSFIHVFANIMQGRTDEVKKDLSERIVKKLKNLLPEVPIISMNIRDFEKASYTNRNMID